MKDYPRWDWLTFAVRFTCGFVLGLLGGGILGHYVFRSIRLTTDYEAHYGIGHFVAASILGGLVCGLLAWWNGDRFWARFRDNGWGFPWI